jgi:hypothetical protein
MSAIHLDRDQVPAIIRQGYNGKKFVLHVVESITIPSEAGLSSGGSRDTYHGVRLIDGSTIPLSDNFSSSWSATRQDRMIHVIPGIAVIHHTFFCGKDMGLTIYINPVNAAQLIPTTVELTVAEREVLIATRRYKSSYGGQDRYQMCGTTMSRDEWNRTKESLIERGFLNRAGALTTNGRNAIA